MTGMSVSILSK